MHYAIGPVVARIHAASMLAIAWDSAAKKRFQVMHNIIRSFDIISWFSCTEPTKNARMSIALSVGKGLGKAESGRADAIKVGVKNNTLGVSELDAFWWSANKPVPSCQIEIYFGI